MIDVKHTATTIQQVGRATEVWVCRAPLSVAERRKVFEGQAGSCSMPHSSSETTVNPLKPVKRILLSQLMLSHRLLRTLRRL